MSSRKRAAISQKEARRLRARVVELERVLKRQRDAWAADWPGGTHIASIGFEPDEAKPMVATRTARRLGHAVVVVENGRSLQLMALPLP